MSFTMTNEVRTARLAGLLTGINFTEFSVLLIAADTCRGTSRVASISMTELVKLSGLERTTMWRAVNRLINLGHLQRLGRGNQFQTSKYEVLPEARCADATSTDAEHVAPAQQATAESMLHWTEEHVALDGEHVALDGSARCTAMQPFPSFPDKSFPTFPEGGCAPGREVTLVGTPEPRRGCRRHPDGTEQLCGPCKDARVRWERWQEQNRGNRLSTVDLKALGWQASKYRDPAPTPIASERMWPEIE